MATRTRAKTDSESAEPITVVDKLGLGHLEIDSPGGSNLTPRRRSARLSGVASEVPDPSVLVRRRRSSSSTSVTEEIKVIRPRLCLRKIDHPENISEEDVVEVEATPSKLVGSEFVKSLTPQSSLPQKKRKIETFEVIDLEDEEDNHVKKYGKNQEKEKDISVKSPKKIAKESEIQTPSTPKNYVTVSKSPVSNPKTPLSLHKSPAKEHKTPVGNPTTPVVVNKTPVSKPSTPVVVNKTPVSKPSTPVVVNKTPVSSPSIPVVVNKSPVRNPSTPTLLIKSPVSEPKTVPSPVKGSSPQKVVSPRKELTEVDNDVTEKESNDTILSLDKNVPKAMDTDDLKAVAKAKLIKGKENENKATGFDKKTEDLALGRRESGRFWKSNRDRFRSTIKSKGLKQNLKHRLEQKESLRRAKELEKSLKEAEKKRREDLKARQELNKKRKEENERKTEIVQMIKNPAKLKRMKKKQLRLLQKRDTVVVQK